MELTEEHKNEVQKNIVEVIASALENNKISQDVLPDISSFVLDKMQSLTSHEALASFVAELASKWPIFSNISVLEKAETKNQQEKSVAEEVLSMAKTGNIEAAINLSKKMTG